MNLIRVTLILAGVVLPAAIYSTAGCSSTATTPGFAADAGKSSSSGSGSTSSGSGGSSTGSGGGSSTGSGSTSSSGGSTSSSGSSSGGSSSSGSSSGGSSSGCTALTTVPAIPAYTAVTAQKSCSMTDVSTFITACASAGATATTCGAWMPAAADTNCGTCIQPANKATTGATIYDSAGNGSTNQPGCVQLSDGNSTCASPLYEALICISDACAACTTQTDFNTCETAALAGACASQKTALSACQTDFADGGTAGSGGPCSTDQEIIYKICGNGQ